MIAQVGVMDLLRFPLFTIGAFGAGPLTHRDVWQQDFAQLAKDSSAHKHQACDVPSLAYHMGSERSLRRSPGHAWVTEYGDPSNATDYPYLRAESPLQNVAVPAGSGQYPATMITTGVCCMLAQWQLS